MKPGRAGTALGVRDMSVLEAGASPRPSDPGTNARNRLVSAQMGRARTRRGVTTPQVEHCTCYPLLCIRLAPGSDSEPNAGTVYSDRSTLLPVGTPRPLVLARADERNGLAWTNGTDSRGRTERICVDERTRV